MCKQLSVFAALDNRVWRNLSLDFVWPWSIKPIFKYATFVQWPKSARATGNDLKLISITHHFYVSFKMADSSSFVKVQEKKSKFKNN